MMLRLMRRRLDMNDGDGGTWMMATLSLILSTAGDIAMLVGLFDAINLQDDMSLWVHLMISEANISLNFADDPWRCPWRCPWRWRFYNLNAVEIREMIEILKWVHILRQVAVPDLGRWSCCRKLRIEICRWRIWNAATIERWRTTARMSKNFGFCDDGVGGVFDDDLYSCRCEWLLSDIWMLILGVWSLELGIGVWSVSTLFSVPISKIDLEIRGSDLRIWSSTFPKLCT
jgi:hypothetical protein